MLAFIPPIMPVQRGAGELILSVQEAGSWSDRRQFASVPRQLYRNDRRWIPFLPPARRDFLQPERNPLLAGGSIAAFLGVVRNLGLGDEVAGTLAAWFSPTQAGVEAGAWGHWGFFETANLPDLADRLFYEAENRLFEHARGMAGIRGPGSIEPLVPPGLLTDGFDAQPAAFLPYNPPFYPEMIEAQGYQPAKTWNAYALDLLPRTTSATPPLEAPKGLRGLAPGELRSRWIEMAQIYRAADARTPEPGAWIPGLPAWLEHLARSQPFTAHWVWRWSTGLAFSRGLAVLAGADSGALAAACLAIPDMGAALRLSRGRFFPLGWLLFGLALMRSKRLRVFPATVPVGWDEEQLGGLYRLLAASARERGYARMDIAPVADADEKSAQALSALGARVVQRFTVYEKTF